MSLTSYILRRTLWLLPVLFVVSVITFGLMHAAPGTPFQPTSDRPLPQWVIDAMRSESG